MGAFKQNNLKRWFAYSTINQIGFILLGLIAYDSFFGVCAVFFYLFSYLFSVTILFSIICTAFSYSTGDMITINDLVSFCKLNTAYAVYITIMLFSLAGLPPFIGFFGKFSILLALFEGTLSFTLFVFLLLNAFSVYYYLRLAQIIWTTSNLAVTPQDMWFSDSDLDFLYFVPAQQTNLKFLIFLFLPLFLSDVIELSVLLAYNDCPWI